MDLHSCENVYYCRLFYFTYSIAYKDKPPNIIIHHFTAFFNRASDILIIQAWFLYIAQSANLSFVHTFKHIHYYDIFRQIKQENRLIIKPIFIAFLFVPHISHTFLPLTLHKILRKLHRLLKAVLQYLKTHSRRKVVDLNTFGLVSENLYQKSFA